ncbi:hypothetical protein NFI96_027552 [Prochilodus magdalenae]|nr:hypothetical protein NFI96_027552 [Prochilodus magdalenae]
MFPVQVFGDGPTPQDSVCFLDILSDPIPEKHYRKTEDLSGWVSRRTGRGPLVDGWRNSSKPIMCSYKKVQCLAFIRLHPGHYQSSLSTRHEPMENKGWSIICGSVSIRLILVMGSIPNIRDILLVGHRQAVAWTDEWHGMSLEDVREFEKKLQLETNSKLKADMTDSGPAPLRPSFSRSVSVTDESSLKKMGLKTVSIPDSPSRPSYSLKSPMRLNSNPE